MMIRTYGADTPMLGVEIKKGPEPGKCGAIFYSNYLLLNALQPLGVG